MSHQQTRLPDSLAGTQQMRELRNKPSACSISGARLVSLSPGRLRPGFGPCETFDEEASFISPATPARQVARDQLFAPSSLRQRGSIDSVALAAGLPSACNADTMVVSTADGAQWNSGNPSAMISIRRLLGLPKGGKSRS